MRALVLGINGQDGSYLADALLARGYTVHGLYRRSSVNNLQRLRHIKDQITLHQGDLTDGSSLIDVIDRTEPDVIYNEADQDDVGWSFKVPLMAVDVTAAPVVAILEIIRTVDPTIRFFQPLSATMFGDAGWFQDETTPLNPLSPYACAKAAAWHFCRYYRQVHDLFVSTAILYNHDSPRRGPGYLLQYLSRTAVKVAQGKQQTLPVGDPDAIVDVGYAAEYMDAVVDMMQLDEPDDFVIATQVPRTVRALAEAALYRVGVYPEDRVTLNKDFERKDCKRRITLVGSAEKARQAFGFCPTMNAQDVVEMLTDHHMKAPT